MTTFSMPIDHLDAQPAVRPRRRPLGPVLASVWIVSLFMLATNDLDAVTHVQELGDSGMLQPSALVEGGRATRQIAFLLLGSWGLLATFWPARPRRDWRLTKPMLLPLAMLLVWALLSITWSADRAFTAKRLTVLICVASAIAGFVRQFSLRDVVTLAVVGGSIQLGADIVADALWHRVPYSDSQYRLSGLQHPNHVGIAAAFVVMGAVCAWDRSRRRGMMAVALVALLALLATKSRSSIFAAAGALAVFAVLRSSPRRLIGGAIVGAILISMTLALSAAGLVPDKLDSLLLMGRADTGKVALTGRPMLWAAALEVAGTDATRLVTGAGYDSFWTAQTVHFVSSRVRFGISEGHNAYFDMLLELGVIGAILYAACLFIAAGRWAWLARTRNRATYAFAAAVSTFAIVHGLTESTMSDSTFGSLIVFSTLAMLAFHAPKPLGQEPA